ncbi:hypothetical protein AAFF_G00306520 [Aldrovandia affinis]|uniref:Uncharacterized protein n=1 Tax=Aldrovandia affinis TaxID=143900 RepID=A0AAD7R803_9TELE|nr:hypothetical protein AAFF_G00306520 [Aldrovandia affinis]
MIGRPIDYLRSCRGKQRERYRGTGKSRSSLISLRRCRSPALALLVLRALLWAFGATVLQQHELSARPDSRQTVIARGLRDGTLALL